MQASLPATIPVTFGDEIVCASSLLISCCESRLRVLKKPAREFLPGGLE